MVRDRMSLGNRMFGRGARTTLCVLAVGVVSAVATASAGATVVYDNVTSPLPGNLPSEAFEATQTAEFGGQVGLAGTNRVGQWVEVVMSSWGCQSGGGTSCQTTPGATFNEPITLNLYNVAAGNQVGSKIASIPQTFAIPFRPSASAICATRTNSTGGSEAGEWYSAADDACYNGYDAPITFDLSGRDITLPSNVIVTVAYNTSDYGYAPYGDATSCHAGGCGYDSLNVALTDGSKTPVPGPSLGTLPDPGDTYVYGQSDYPYCDNGAAGINVFRLDAPPAAQPSCWTGYQPEIEIDATVPSAVVPATVTSNAPSALTLSTLSTQPSFGGFQAGVAQGYVASMTVGATATGAPWTLTAQDASGNDHMVNGAYSLQSPLRGNASDSTHAALPFMAIGAAGASPTTLLTETDPVANDAITVGFKQAISATEPLRSGTYGETVLLTLSEVNP